MGVLSLAQVQSAESRYSFCRHNHVFSAGIVVLGLALIWAARIVVVVYAPPPMLEFINTGELER